MSPPKGVYLPILKLHSILAVANLLAHNNISQVCYCGQISLQSAAVNYSFSDNLTPLGVPFILLAMVHFLLSNVRCLRSKDNLPPFYLVQRKKDWKRLFKSTKKTANLTYDQHLLYPLPRTLKCQARGQEKDTTGCCLQGERGGGRVEVAIIGRVWKKWL